MSSGSNADFTWFMLSAMLNTIESEIVCGTKSFLVRGDEGDGGGPGGAGGAGGEGGRGPGRRTWNSSFTRLSHLLFEKSRQDF